MCVYYRIDRSNVYYSERIVSFLREAVQRQISINHQQGSSKSESCIIYTIEVNVFFFFFFTSKKDFLKNFMMQQESEEVLLAGYVQKQGKSRNKWRYRWIELRSNKELIYKKRKESEKIQGRIDLTSVYVFYFFQCRVRQLTSSHLKKMQIESKMRRTNISRTVCISTSVEKRTYVCVSCR